MMLDTVTNCGVFFRGGVYVLKSCWCCRKAAEGVALVI